MRLRNSSERYGAVAMALHWAVLALVLLSWASGQFGDDLPRGAARAAGLFVHISTGLAVAIFVIARMLWRLADPPPAGEPTFLGKWGDWSGRAVHYALYALLVIIPAVGVAVQFARGNALPMFGLFEIASPWSADRPLARSLKEVHEVLANGMMILIGLHAAAALAHHFIFGDRTLSRMLPGSVR
jgi:cytochrome b561